MKRLGVFLTVAIAGLALGAENSGSRFYVTKAASALIEEGLAAPAPTGSEAAAFQAAPAPSVRMRANVAQATTAPWIESNAWRFERGLKKVNHEKLPAGSALLAAAEAFAFGADAILNPDPADVQPLSNLLRFLKSVDQPPMPVMANIGVVDDKSPAMDEVLNMLTRRNLLYRVVSAPDRKLDVTVQLGTKDFPRESAQNPSDFAARVRAKVDDDRRLVRLYGTSTMIAHLTGDANRARLQLLSYTAGGRGGRGAGGGGQSIRVRLLGRYRPVKFAGFGSANDAALADIENPGKATEFSVPGFNTYAVIDLEAIK